MEIIVYNSQGEQKGNIELPAIFQGKVNTALLYEVVNAYLANQRIGTASTKTRAEVSGGGRKPWRQKEAGRARAGSIRSPLWRHGGITFGPKPRSYRQDLPKKKLKLALSSALSEKVKENAVIILDELSITEPKTKNIREILKKLGIKKEKTLLITDKLDKNLKLSTRNIPYLEVVEMRNLNTYQVLNAVKIVVVKKAMEIKE